MTQGIKKCRFELVDKPKYQRFRKFIRNDLAEKLVKTLRTNKTDSFRRRQGFNVTDAFNTKEQTALEAVKDAFLVLGYRIDLYFNKHKIAIEVDEFGYNDRNID